MRTLSRYLLRRHLASFSFAFTGLTSLLLLNQIVKQLPGLLSRGVPGSVIVQVFGLSIPFIIAMAVPMAVFIAVLRVFSRLAGDGQITTIGPGSADTLRVIVPVLGAAACLGAILFLWNDQVLPRSNHRLRTLLVTIASSRTASPATRVDRSDREMSSGEMRGLVRSAREEAASAAIAGREDAADAARRRAAMYEIEIQKKYVMAAACLPFVLFGAPIALRFGGGGVGLTIGMSLAVFALFYVGLIGGEDLGDRTIISPFWAMWTPTLIFGAIGLFTVWRIPRSAFAGPARAQSSPAVPHEDAAPGQAPWPQTGNYITRLWRGQISLDMTYWVWGVLFGGFLRRVLETLSLLYTSARTPGSISAFEVLSFVYYGYISVAIWRSSGRYPGRRIWIVLARLSVVLGVIFTLIATFNPGLIALLTGSSR